MHQTKKGNQWYFGMKAHIGVDAKSDLTHSLETTSANEHDLNQVGNLLHDKLKELKKHPRKNKSVIVFDKLKSSVRAKVEL